MDTGNSTRVLSDRYSSCVPVLPPVIRVCMRITTLESMHAHTIPGHFSFKLFQLHKIRISCERTICYRETFAHSELIETLYVRVCVAYTLNGISNPAALPPPSIHCIGGYYGKISIEPYLIVLLPWARSPLIDDFACEQRIFAGINFCVFGLFGKSL